jgi:thymidylate synthase
VGDLDDMIYDGLLIDGGDENGKWFARIPTKEEFIGRIKSDVEFAKQWGELGPIYGKQWRKWDGKNGRIDQIDDLVRELKTNPDSRRLMVSAWNVGELDQMVLPPCHYGFQIYTREENEKRYISLMWNQRSVDTFLGLPFNIASYGLLLHIIANEVDMIPDELIGNLGDVHLYSNHIEQAKEQISRESFNLPTLKTNVKIDGICCATPDDFVLEGYQYHPTIKAPLSN